MDPMPQAIRLLAVAACGLFAGAATYINLVEHPARMSCGTALAATEFVPSYKRGTIMQAPLAVLGMALSMQAWLMGAGPVWLVAGVLLGSVVPFTLLVLMPTNHRLVDPALDRGSDQARALLVRWEALHRFRTVASLAAFVLLLSALAGGA